MEWAIYGMSNTWHGQYMDWVIRRDFEVQLGKGLM